MDQGFEKSCDNCNYEYTCNWKRCGKDKENWRPDLDTKREMENDGA